MASLWVLLWENARVRLPNIDTRNVFFILVRQLYGNPRIRLPNIIDSKTARLSCNLFLSTYVLEPKSQVAQYSPQNNSEVLSYLLLYPCVSRGEPKNQVAQYRFQHS